MVLDNMDDDKLQKFSDNKCCTLAEVTQSFAARTLTMLPKR